MTGKERIARILKHEPVDRVGVFEHFWVQTRRLWAAQGHVVEGEDFEKHFGLDLVQANPYIVTADPSFGLQVMEETDEYTLLKDGNASILRKEKGSDDPARAVGFTIRERRDWEEHIKPRLIPSRDRIKFDEYRLDRDRAQRGNRFFCCASRLTFQAVELICGHEHMLTGMLLDPDWFKEMADQYADFWIGLMEILFKEEGQPDAVWFNEDLGFKERPFMSPAMHRELIQPAQRKVFDYVHGLGLPVIMHSCGMVEELIPGLIEAGIDCLQALEVKAGMDPVRIKRQYGDRIALCGGINALHLVNNDRGMIRKELETRIPALMEGSGYILHSDHSITPQVEYETYRYFLDQGLRLGMSEAPSGT